ncbi:MAG: glycosyltransferase family 4 protein [Candidatus Melainabacteria bacterium]|nr:glycosyltransferase family 4 protein [Candidatus Melainabacteria bacterium]
MVNYEFPPIGGGGGTTTRYLAKYLVKLGVEVNVYTAKPMDKDVHDHPEGFRLHYVGPVKKKLTTTHLPELARFALTIMYYAKPVIKEVQPNLIHCFFTIPSGCFGLYAKKIFKIPYITSALGADVPGFNIGDWRLDVYHTFTHSLTKSIWNNSSHLVANSTSLMELCKQFSPKQSVEVITNGVDTEVFYPGSKKNNSQNNEVQLLYISRLTWQKGIETLIHALGILKARGITNYKLTVAGDGHLKEPMFSLIDKYQIRDKVNYLGWKNLEELPDIYRTADIFILPSVMEGMPSVVLQAMATGLPIIASRVKGFEEILEENINGLTAEYNNPREFADAIEKLIKVTELREKMSRSSFEKARKFSWESIAEQYLELYTKTVYGTVKNKEKSLLSNFS